MRQTDEIRIISRCYKPTVYEHNELSYAKKETCPYLVDGECELNFCVRKNDGRDRDQED